MIKDNEKIKIYLDSVVNSVFKILPLYEEKNVGIKVYIDSLLFELYGLDKSVSIEQSDEYISLLSTLESVKAEVCSDNSTKSVVKREVFKCIHIVKNMISKLKEGA